MTKLGFFITGLLVGAVAVSVLAYFLFLKRTNEYVELTKDYAIENGGVIKHGSVLKIDKPFSEGFTRYILYLNLSDGEQVLRHETERKDVVIPYWLQSDTTNLE